MTKKLEKGQEYSINKLIDICQAKKWNRLVTLLTSNPPEKNFISDGCSGPCPDVLRGIDILDLCIEHDIFYFCGGTKIDRLEADQKFCLAIAKRVGVDVAEIIYSAVRIGGGDTIFDKSYEWGFGYNKT